MLIIRLKRETGDKEKRDKLGCKVGCKVASLSFLSMCNKVLEINSVYPTSEFREGPNRLSSIVKA
jgi:hypothetical protein